MTKYNYCMHQLKSYKNGLLSRGLSNQNLDSSAKKRHTLSEFMYGIPTFNGKSIWTVSILIWPARHMPWYFSSLCRKRLKKWSSDSICEQKVCHRCAKKSTTLFITILSKMAAATQRNSIMYTENIQFYRFLHTKICTIYMKGSIFNRGDSI